MYLIPKLISKSPLICSQNCPPKRGAKPRARQLIQYGGVCLKKSEPILQKIPTNETETMRPRQGKLFFWGFGFALPRLISDFASGGGGVWGGILRLLHPFSFGEIRGGQKYKYIIS
jgi:hypothetical protein